MRLKIKQPEIDSIAKAIEAMRELENDRGFIEDDWPLHKFPFGLWFRGHSEIIAEMQPSVFRKKTVIDGKKTTQVHHDETNLFVHCKLRVPQYQQTYRSVFDWLCLLQHYSMPTRLLDWSETILPALYFAVKDKPEEDGELVVLNARRLNKSQKSRPSICTATNPQIIIRAEMADTRSAKALRNESSVIEAARKLGILVENAPNWMEPFRKPMAVYPSRLNERMIFQASVFTLHGGKIYRDDLKKYYKNDDIPGPISLEEIDNGADNEEGKILRRYRIPKDWKEPISRELFNLGIHEGTLFPEIDHQANYLKQLW